MCHLKARVPKALTAPRNPAFVNESTDAVAPGGRYAVPNYSNVMFVLSPS